MQLSFLLGLATLLALAVPVCAQTTAPASIRLTLAAQPQAKVSPELFGQFLERASFGEPGPEHALVPNTRVLQPKVLDLLKQMHIPLIRFPGGTDVDYINWLDSIDNAPGRAAATRPATKGHRGQTLTNNFGLDEYFQLQSALNCQTLLVVNFRDALLKKRPLHDAALHAAGLVAYVNAAQDAKLPEGMADYAALRAKNGHPDPYKVKYFQLGNELWFFADTLTKEAALGIKTKAEAAEWFAQCVITYADLMRAVDPSIELILDGPRSDPDSVLTRAAANPEIKKRIQFLTVHAYGPGASDKIKKGGETVESRTLTDDDYWNAWVSTPGNFAPDGTNIAIALDSAAIAKLGYKTACTEWNWNGFGFYRIKRPLGVSPAQASAIGAAGFIHGLLRDADHVQLATQSLLLGSNWHIAAIRVDPAAKADPFYLPQGLVTTFYSQHHGPQLIGLRSENVPTFPQPYQIDYTHSVAKVAAVDAVATLSDRTLYLHLINRDRHSALPIALDLSAFALAPSATLHQLAAAPAVTVPADPADSFAPSVLTSSTRAITLALPVATLTLPPASITIVEISRK